MNENQVLLFSGEVHLEVKIVVMWLKLYKRRGIKIVLNLAKFAG